MDLHVIYKKQKTYQEPTSRDDSVVVLGGPRKVEVWDDSLGELEIWEGRFEGGGR